MKIKKIFGKIIDGIVDCERFVLYTAQLLVFDSFRNFVKKEVQDRSLLVLVNGPSLKESLSQIIDNEEYINNDIITVNFMANDVSFFTIKPRYHVISDYALFHDSQGNEEKVGCFINNINNKVDWDLTLFITYSLWKDKRWIRRIENKRIKIVPFHSIEAPESIKVSYLLSRLGWLGANYGSVLHHAIYLGMLSGYKKEYVYGADHTFFDGLCVDGDNRVCRKITHFYDEETEIRPIYHIYTGEKKPYKMSFFLMEYQRVFYGHDILRFIADKTKVKIINKTPISLIDSYERKEY